LYDGIQNKKSEEYKFQAALVGVDLTSSEKKASNKENAEAEIPLFGDPDDFQSMSVEEKEEMTKKMKGKHESWSGKSFLKGK